MGRIYGDKKYTVEDCLSISIPFLKKLGFLSSYGLTSGSLTWTQSLTGIKNGIGIDVFIGECEKYVEVKYNITDKKTGTKTDYDYNFQLTTTPCNYGGVRYWFICSSSRNGVHCGRRVAKLYKPLDAIYFRCRHCYNLSYDSRNEPRLGRFGNIGYPIVAERLYEELFNQIKRWTYKGKPTKKARKLTKLEEKMAKSNEMIRKRNDFHSGNKHLLI